MVLATWVIILICFFFISVIGVVSLYAMKRNRRVVSSTPPSPTPNTGGGTNTPPPTSPPTNPPPPSKVGDLNLECVLCAEDYDAVDPKFTLDACGHAFGRCCLAIHILTQQKVKHNFNPECPVCRARISMEDKNDIGLPSDECFVARSNPETKAKLGM
jgi:hypothetical protein